MGSLYQCKKSKLTTRKLCRKSQGLCYYYICRTTVVSNAERGRASRWSCCSVLGAKSAPSARRNFHFRDYRILKGSMLVTHCRTAIPHWLVRMGPSVTYKDIRSSNK
eukprot:scaffold1196_cov118-Alexandrium_tamarense.AAC.5